VHSQQILDKLDDCKASKQACGKLSACVHVLFNCLNNWMQFYASFDFVVSITKMRCVKDHVLLL
jgi:hypothetical protein